MVREPGSKRLRARWVAASLALHAALLGVSTSRRAPSPSHRPASEAAAPAQELDVELEATAVPRGVPEPQTAEPPSSVTARSPRSASLTRPSPAAGQGASELEAAGPDGVGVDAPGDASETGAGVDGEPSGPRLSLTDLGVGDGNPFVRPSTPEQQQRDKARRVKQKLDRALAQGLLDRDSALGLGAGSPVLRVLEAATYASATPGNGNASFTFIIDGEGKVVSGSLGAVSSEREAWERVARKAVRDLASHKLRVPRGKGVKLTVRVTSRIELPSGADPGVEVRALGLPLKRGAGERSTRIEILNPKNPLAPLSLAGDPADIGAKARRMVRAHVTSEELL